jgi:hypothetical protein
MKLTKASVTARDLIERDLIQTMVFPMALAEIDQTMKDPSKPIETKIGPHLMKIIDKFPDLKEQWDEMSPAYFEAVRTHEQWCALFSTPPNLPSPAIGLPAATATGLPAATISEQDLRDRETVLNKVFPWTRIYIDDTMNDPTKPIKRPIGSYVMGIINKFPDLKQEWDNKMSTAYYTTISTHAEWQKVNSTLPTLASPAIGLPAHGQSHIPSTPVPNSDPTAPLPTQTGGALSANPVPPPNPAFPPLQPVGGPAGSTYAGTGSASVLEFPNRTREQPAAPAGNTIRLPPRPTTRTMPGDRPSLIAPGLDKLGFWYAGKGGEHLQHSQRPGGRLDTQVKADLNESNKEAKKESKPQRLNLCHNEDPYICWKIFGTKAGCPHANDEMKCRFYHHVHQDILDFVVANRGVNKEYIAWMLNNYKRNVPTDHQLQLAVPTVESAFAPPRNPRYRPTAARGRRYGAVVSPNSTDSRNSRDEE